MPKPPRSTPLEAFGSELTSTLVAASKKELTLDFTPALGGYAAAIRFVHRLYSLRKAMRAAQHELYPLAARVRSTILWGKAIGFAADPELKTSGRNVKSPKDPRTHVHVTLSPQDLEFRAVVLAAGVTEDALERDPLENLDTAADTAPAEGGSVADVLDRIENRKQ